MKLATPDHNAISGRVVIVTGAVSGIGRALATNFCQDGAQVVAVDRNRNGLEGLRVESTDRIETLVADLREVWGRDFDEGLWQRLTSAAARPASGSGRPDRVATW